MLEIKTEHGNFGTFRDLRIFMEHEKIDKVHVIASYIFDKFAEMDLTLEQVQDLEREVLK